jgi:hypothetical protein
MRVDLRQLIGLLFLALGAIVLVQGVVVGSRVLGINVNFWWGVVMLAFGGVMTLMGRQPPHDRT